MKKVEVIDKKDFKKPLVLIGFRSVQVSYDDDGELLIRKQVIQVPGSTAWVCISVTDMDVCLAPTSQETGRYLNQLCFNAVVDELSPPMLKYSVRAQMISSQPNDHWNGTIWLTILCFGEIPEPET